jgi:hypothetical protein
MALIVNEQEASMNRKATAAVLALVLAAAGCAGDEDTDTAAARPAATVVSAVTAALAAGIGDIGAQSAAGAGGIRAMVDVSADLCQDGGSAIREDVGDITTYTLTDCRNVAAGGEATLTGVATFTDAAGGYDVTVVGGTADIATDCYTGVVTFETGDPLFLPDGAYCPIEGDLVLGNDFVARGTFGAGGSLDVDAGDDGDVDAHFDDCLDADNCS